MRSFVQSNEHLELFRFVSFFDLYDILVNRRLRFSKLSTFADRNEGIGQILHAQDHELFRQRYIDSHDIAHAYESILENNYLSCWTTESDLVAMWALYSPDCSSIRISTTVGKLYSALANLQERLTWTNALKDEGTRKQICSHGVLGPVEYVDFFVLRDEIRKKYQSFDQKTASAFRQNENYGSDGFKKDYEEFCNQRIISRDGLFLKDKSYIHENEVRAVLRSGVSNDLLIEKWLKNPLAIPIDEARKDELPDFLYADINGHFVDAVCFDPRMPKYRRRVFESILETALPAIRESRAFGCALYQDSFASDFDGNPV